MTYKRLTMVEEHELRQAAIRAVLAWADIVKDGDADYLGSDMFDAMTGLRGAVDRVPVKHESSIQANGFPEGHPDHRKRAACTCGWRQPWTADGHPMDVNYVRDMHVLAYEDEGAR